MVSSALSPSVRLWLQSSLHYAEYGCLPVYPSRTEVYFGHHNENKNDENSVSLSKPVNIGTHCEALETSFQMVPLAFWLRQFGGKCFMFGIFLKIPSVLKELICNVCLCWGVHRQMITVFSPNQNLILYFLHFVHDVHFISEDNN
jgi:hypothetical protein